MAHRFNVEATYSYCIRIKYILVFLCKAFFQNHLKTIADQHQHSSTNQHHTVMIGKSLIINE